jgi:homopolymeric O-antigen transport system ATP-binding protein
MDRDCVIEVEKLGKQYRITAEQERYRTLRDAIVRAFARPIRRVRSRGAAANEANSVWALADVSFQARRGDVIGVIGRNGAGKSTLLKVLSRITEPTTGVARVRGRVGALLEVGTGFHPELSGRDNVYLNGTILGMRRSEISRKFDEIVEFAEVARFIDTPVKHYSSGMYLRLAFAVAAHLEPDILVVDEVLAVGDVEFQQKCLGKMDAVARGGRTVLFVSHNMPAVTHLCTRAISFANGQLVREGEVADVVGAYLRSSRASQVTSLASRRDRMGTGRLRFSRAWISAADAHAVNTVASGDEVSFHVEYAAQEFQARAMLLISITIRDLHGQLLFSLANFLTGQHIEVDQTTGHLWCTTPELPLNAGSYEVDIWASVDGTAADYVLGAFQFSVVAADVFGSGKVPTARKHGPLFVRHSWVKE